MQLASCKTMSTSERSECESMESVGVTGGRSREHADLRSGWFQRRERAAVKKRVGWIWMGIELRLFLKLLS